MDKNRFLLRFFLALSTLVVLAVVVWTGIPVLQYTIARIRNDQELIAVRQNVFYRAAGNEHRVDKIIDESRLQFDNQDYMDQYQALLEINDESVGWITIEDTKIDYPVVQTEDNLYYLNRNILKHYSNRGAIFADFRNFCDGSDKNLIIYGHNMFDGSMFGRLYKFKSPAYYKNHPYITLNLKGEYSRWEIFAVYITNDDPVRISFSSDHDFLEYIKIIQKDQIYDTDVTINADDAILTISTCTNVENDGRLILHAKRISSSGSE